MLSVTVYLAYRACCPGCRAADCCLARKSNAWRAGSISVAPVAFLRCLPLCRVPFETLQRSDGRGRRLLCAGGGVCACVALRLHSLRHFRVSREFPPTDGIGRRLLSFCPCLMEREKMYIYKERMRCVRVWSLRWRCFAVVIHWSAAAFSIRSLCARSPCPRDKGRR